MGTPHTSEPQALTAGPGAPIPVAFTGRTSTLYLQDPAASMRRQARECADKLPEGMFIAAYYWDIESGGLDIEQRGHASTWQQVDVGIPRDGGLADLLAEAASPTPRFAAVICEDIERSARDTYNALKLEKELASHGIPLFATDEPISVDGMNATTVLVRRVKQGVAEWFRLQIKEKAWKGLREHSLAGWNIGPAPYGYQAERVTHPVPAKAAQGRTKTRLALDPERGPVVAQIYAWRVHDHLGVATITDRLNADPASYPPPPGAIGWTVSTVAAILANPKYTGHMVYGRRRSQNGRTRPVPPEQWIWTPEPVHPAIITRAMWDAAQKAGAAHATSRDTDPDEPARQQRIYVLRSRIRCRIDNRRMTGITRPSSRYYTDGPDVELVYYRCPHSTRNPRHVATQPDHPSHLSVREDILLAAIRDGFDERIFGPDRAALLTATTPATAAADQARRDKDTARLTRRLRQIDAAEKGHTLEMEALTTTGATHAALTAMRARHIERFTELEAERAAINTQLTALAAPASDDPGDPALLDELPHLAGILHDAPIRLQQQLYDAFDLQLLYSKKHHRVHIRATITPSTRQALAVLITDSAAHTAQTAETGQPPATAPDAHLAQAPISPTGHRDHGPPVPAPPEWVDPIRLRLNPMVGAGARS